MTEETASGVDSQPELAERIKRAKCTKKTTNGKAKSKKKGERKPSAVTQYLHKDNDKAYLREYKCPYQACDGKTIKGPWSFKQHLKKVHNKEI